MILSSRSVRCIEGTYDGKEIFSTESDRQRESVREVIRHHRTHSSLSWENSIDTWSILIILYYF